MIRSSLFSSWKRFRSSLSPVGELPFVPSVHHSFIHRENHKTEEQNATQSMGIEEAKRVNLFNYFNVKKIQL